MRKNILGFLIGFSSLIAFSQSTTTLTGTIIDAQTQQPLQNIEVGLRETSLNQQTNTFGKFEFTNLTSGSFVLVIQTTSYITKNIPITVDGTTLIDLGAISLQKDITQEQNDNLITLTENDLNDEGGADITSGLLQASRDVFSNVAAFEFSQTFFRIRGLDSENGFILINGVKMNKLFNGRPQWSNWGGLNDVMRNQELTQGSTPSDYNFGGLLGTTNINTRASGYRPGIRLSSSASNRSYAGRLMATYSSGLINDEYAFTISASRRFANQGYVEGTLYDANSLFASFEYKFNENHTIDFTSIYAFNRRGRSSPNTQEVIDLKNIQYNSYWGYQNGKKRNSRVREIEEPIVMLSHFWTINDNTRLNTNIAYQTGRIGNSRLDFGGTTAFTTPEGDTYYSGNGTNPDPTYYQKLPSFYLSFDDGINYEEVFNRQQEFVNDGQLNWDSLYDANRNNTASGRNATHILYEDRNDDNQFSANTILNTQVSDNIAIDAAINYQKLTSKNFANLIDLLGGNGYLDVDNFAEDPALAPNDLQNPNRIVQEGDKFRYNFNLYADVIDGFAQAKFKTNKVDFYLGGNFGRTSYQREGLYQSGAFADNSFGKGQKLDFNNLGGKAGFTYKITGRHLIDVNAAYVQNAPNLRNTYSNSRQNHDIVRNITEQKTQAIDASYIIRSPFIKSRLTGYYYNIQDATEISFFFVDGLSGDTSSFVQEILTGIEKQHAGLELGIEAQITSTIKLKGAAAVGEYIYNNNPDLYLTSDDFTEDFPTLQSNLKNYKIAGGPQRAFSLGFEYRDPEFWWFGASTNYFSNAYVDISPLNRTSNFYTDVDGLPFTDYNEDIARQLLQQEEFDDYFLVNLVGGKSWRIQRKYYIGLFASISNVLNQEYKSGGFEQSRNGNYRTLLEESQNPTPVFGSKYWFGRGTTYFVNLYISF